MSQFKEKEQLQIDYPEKNEEITSPFYTLRVSAPENAALVEVSINGSEWMPCRPAVGFWWYDWSGYHTGNHQLQSRVHLEDGKTFTSPQRQTRVNNGPQETGEYRLQDLVRDNRTAASGKRR